MTRPKFAIKFNPPCRPELENLIIKAGFLTSRSLIISKNAEKKQACEDCVCSPNAHDHAHTYADGATCSHANDHGGRAAGKYNGDKFDAKNAAVKSKIANDEEGGFASKNLTRKLAE